MNLSSSTYYYKSKPKEDERWLVELIEKILEEFPTFGHRRIRIKLKEMGYIVNHKRIIRVMHENGLMSKRRAKIKAVTTNSNHNFRKYPNMIKDIKVTNINQVVVGDVTQISNKGQDYFIATLMDLCNREVVGCAISKSNDTELALACLEDFVNNREKENIKGCIHHTDSDVRYCSYAYTNKLKELGLEISMCKGNAYENAYAESFFKTLKYEEINISEYKNTSDLINNLFLYIKKYNTRRPHSSLKGMTPSEYKEFLKKGEKIK